MMNNRGKRWALLLLALALCCTAFTAYTEEWSAIDAAKSSFQLLVGGNFEEVAEQADPAVQSLLTTDALAQGWDLITATLGAYVEIVDAAEMEMSGMVIVQLLVAHEKGQAVASFQYTEQHTLMGIGLQSLEAEASEETPLLPLPDGASEEEVLLRPGAEDETGGSLTIPAGDGPFPAVILIQGSGASDRDEAVFGVKPFRDIAMGLAERGIASLRYDKFTYAHPDLYDTTIEQEYVMDARDAVALLKSDDRIGDIYLAGHSQGGMLIPRLLAACGGDAKGGIILAGTPRPLWAIQRMQNEDSIASLPEEAKEMTQGVIDGETAKGERLSEMDDAELAELSIFGIPAFYHKDLMSVDPIETALSLKLPLFILQGEKDFQVKLKEDYAAWQAGLGSAGFVTYKSYPDLTHLFMPLEGESTGTVADYEGGGHVSPEVIGDMADWIHAREE